MNDCEKLQESIRIAESDVCYFCDKFVVKPIDKSICPAIENMVEGFRKLEEVIEAALGA